MGPSLAESPASAETAPIPRSNIQGGALDGRLAEPQGRSGRRREADRGVHPGHEGQGMGDLPRRLLVETRLG
jgi:hypothetical protein